MMETLFTILIAGCSHDASLCEALERSTIAARDLAACEVVLDAHLMSEGAEWPVYQGICLAGEAPALAVLPDWWPAENLYIASR